MLTKVDFEYNKMVQYLDIFVWPSMAGRTKNSQKHFGVWGVMMDRKSSGMAHSLLDTPLSTRSDDDQEMKFLHPASCLAAIAR